ncbi:MAG: sulfide/dihydroorotate dehydrogenase-like FAD/NAD-binding protein [Christensenellaceae bacterium]
MNPTVTLMEVDAPFIAKKHCPDVYHFACGRRRRTYSPHGCGLRPRKGTVTIIFRSSAQLRKNSTIKVGDCLSDFVGPLGNLPKQASKVCVVGGGVGCAIALPIAKELHAKGCEVTSIIGFRSRELVILEDEFKAASKKFFMMTDDGSYGRQGNVCVPLNEMLAAGEKFDAVITIGPLIMMKFVCAATKPYGIKTIASMNPIMIDGTGMCGGCRLTVGGKMKFACVDGPDFDGHEIDFDEAMSRSRTYADFESHQREETCNLFKKEVK